MSDNYCLIMAGGAGTRFWPRSREERPKQYLKMFGNESLIQQTINRFSKILNQENIFVVSARSQQEILESQAAGIPRENLIYEPVGKNTLPAIGLASLFIERVNPEAILVVTPSDHLVKQDELFRQTIESAIKVAGTSDGIVTIGITPTFPSTGYGYVQTGAEVREGQQITTFVVRKFVEKPDAEKAGEYLRTGGYFWNSGIFVFKVSVLLQAIKTYAPNLYKDLQSISERMDKEDFENSVDSIYRKVESISIDYGILEKADNIFLVRGDFEWNDLGSWEEVYKYSPKDINQNAVTGEAVLYNTRNSYVSASDCLVAVVGLEDVIVVQEGNTLLVCKRNNAEEIKKVVAEINLRGLRQYT